MRQQEEMEDEDFSFKRVDNNRMRGIEGLKMQSQRLRNRQDRPRDKHSYEEELYYYIGILVNDPEL